LKEKNDLLDQFSANVEVATAAMDRIRDAQKTIGMVNKLLADREGEDTKELKKMGKTMMDAMKEITALYRPKKGTQGIYRNPALLNAKLGNAYFHILQVQGKVGQTQKLEVAHAAKALKPVIEKVNTFFKDEWPKYKKAVEAANLSFFKAYEALEVKE